MKHPLAIFGIFFSGVVVIDQVTKFVFTHQAVELNQGVSLGLFGALPTPVMILGLVVVLGLVAKLSFPFWKEHPSVAGLFFGGAVSNILDRMLLGGVRDWLPIPLTSITNNLADWVICLALIMLLGKKATTKVQ